MTTEHQPTPEEKAYERLLDEVQERFSRPAEALFYRARDLAYAEHMIRNYIVDEEDFVEAEAKMSAVATALTDRDQEILTQIVRAARAAADSLDPEDYETVAGFRVHPGNLHDWYTLTADMVEHTLEEENARRRAREDPENVRRRVREDPSNIPFY